LARAGYSSNNWQRLLEDIRAQILPIETELIRKTTYGDLFRIRGKLLGQNVDFPEFGLHKGDLATIVEKHEGKPGQETGYSLEVFNAVGETIAVLVLEESRINPVKANEILHVRRFDKMAAV